MRRGGPRRCAVSLRGAISDAPRSSHGNLAFVSPFPRRQPAFVGSAEWGSAWASLNAPNDAAACAQLPAFKRVIRLSISLFRRDCVRRFSRLGIGKYVVRDALSDAAINAACAPRLEFMRFILRRVAHA